MAIKQNIVTSQRRHVAKIDFSAESASLTFGLTGSAFDAIGGSDGVPFIAGITAQTPALSRVLWTANGATFGYHLKFGPDDSNGATAMSIFGTNGEFSFERMTIKNKATTPDGVFHVKPTAVVTGTVILEFVL